MAKKQNGELWDGITIDDFINESNIDDVDIGDFNTEKMAMFSANVNLARQLVRAADSLKPVNRRILYVMYQLGAHEHKIKSTDITSATMRIHPHGDMPIYVAMVRMTQYWKKSVPLVGGDSNFGSVKSPNGYADYRYTKAELTDYAYDCFFKDFDKSAVTKTSAIIGYDEPQYLPSRYPNVLVNGTDGIGNGYSASIPPYNCNDIVDAVITLIDDPNADIFMIPDFPTSCDIVDDGNFEEISKTGDGTIRMRANIDIEETDNSWVLRVTSIPYGVSYDVLYKSILNLGRRGDIILNQRLPISDGTRPVYIDGQLRMQIDLAINVDKSQDPKKVRALLFKRTDLEKTMSIKFTVIRNDFEIVKSNVKDVLLIWLAERRLYKRNLLNQKIVKLTSQIDIANVIIDLLSRKSESQLDDLYMDLIRTIRKSKPDEILDNLKAKFNLNSYQASVVRKLTIDSINADSLQKYIEERDKNVIELNEYRDTAKSARKIDKIIKKEVECLKDYATPRKSKIIIDDGGDTISSTEHLIVFTDGKNIKKLPYPVLPSHKSKPLGVFDQGDAPDIVIQANNLDLIFIMDDFGKYTIMKISDIVNTPYSSFGETLYSIAKLEGKVVFAKNIPSKDYSHGKSKKKSQKTVAKASSDIYLLTLSDSGYMKKTKFNEYIYGSDNTILTAKCIKGANTRDNDKLIYATLWDESNDMKMLITTKRGNYITINSSFVPELGKVSIGNRIIDVDNDDACSSIDIIYPSDEFIVVVTSRGCCKKVETKFLLEATKIRDGSYLTALDDNDELIYAGGCSKGDIIEVSMKSGTVQYIIDDFPTTSRKAKPTKYIPVPNGDKIIHVSIK